MNRLFLFFTAIVSVGLLLGHDNAWAQSSLGIGRAEQSIPTGGYFEGFFNWVRSQQAEFHRSIKTILIEMRREGTHFWSLVTISFLYGVFHAVGPGHGKIVVSSYMLANEVEAKRGVVLSLAASLMQGVTAILAISFFMVALRGTGIKTSELTFGLEAVSYIGVMGLGIWLLWRKALGKGHHHDHSHEDDGTCDHCGHAHAPDPKSLSGKFGLREAWSAILAVGLRPCTGALIVLVFCFANGLYLAGILSTFAMSIGTGIAVSTMAILAVVAKNAALRIANMQDSVATVHKLIEVAGAALIFLIGLVLFVALVTG
ncbi:MAG: nickel/cobalt transporter [Rhizobiaceae bacterium]